jgi:hypothetical protein
MDSRVEAPGIEPDQRRTPDTLAQQSGSIGVHTALADVPDAASNCPIDGREVTESPETYELSNVAETALAKALVLAAKAKRWEIVAALAEELRRREHCDTAGSTASDRMPATRLRRRFTR